MLWDHELTGKCFHSFFNRQKLYLINLGDCGKSLTGISSYFGGMAQVHFFTPKKYH